MEPELLRRRLEAIAEDASLLDPDNLSARTEALEVLDLADELVRRRASFERLYDIRQLIDRLRPPLAAANAALFDGARAYLRSKARTPEGVRQLFDRFTAYRPGAAPPLHLGWDGLDLLVDGILDLDAMHIEPAPLREADMIRYEPAPARVVLELVDLISPTPEELFYDLGSGLGQIVILYHLLTGLPARGVEIEADYVRIARECSAALRLEGVEFVTEDVRRADLSDGTLFFMFTPFVGRVMRAVLERLEAVAATHPIRVCSYGSCTMDVAGERWLRLLDPARLHAYKLAIFESVI